MMENDHCVATIHAEANAIIQAAKNGVMIDGATIYVTASPCWTCFKQIANAGIRRIVYGEFYRDERIFSVAERLGMELLHIQSHVQRRPRPDGAASRQRASGRRVRGQCASAPPSTLRKLTSALFR